MLPRAPLIALALALVACVTSARAQTAGPTLSLILNRGFLTCGVTEAEGFAMRDAQQQWRGFDVDFCRALASAIFDDPKKAQMIEAPAKERAAMLQAGWIDVFASAAGWTLSRDAGRNLHAAITFHDGQGFLTRKQRSFASARDLDNVSVCAQQGTPYELTAAEYFSARSVKYEMKLFLDFDGAMAAYDSGQCDALTADISTLHAMRTRLTAPAEHTVLPDLLSKAPRGALVRENDDQWLNIVRWTLFAMLDAEELDVSKANADTALKSENPRIRQLLGVEGDRGANLALSGYWAYRIIKHVGNYADIFERNLGQASPLGMERRQNALWNKGGLMYGPAVK